MSDGMPKTPRFAPRLDPASSSAPGTALHALTAKRMELTGRRTDLLAELAAVERDLASVEAAIPLFQAPDLPSPAERVGKPLKRFPTLRRGDVAAEALALLREASRPLSTQETARLIAVRRNMILDQPRFDRLCLLVVKNLRCLQARGLVGEAYAPPRKSIFWQSLPARHSQLPYGQCRTL